MSSLVGSDSDLLIANRLSLLELIMSCHGHNCSASKS